MQTVKSVKEYLAFSTGSTVMYFDSSDVTIDQCLHIWVVLWAYVYYKLHNTTV